MGVRTLIVGDVHGCREELEDLLSQADFEPGDELVFVGDLVAKGPDSQGVLQMARRLGAKAVRGNHDQRCLRWWEAQGGKKRSPTLREDHQAVVEQLGTPDWEWLSKTPLWLELPDYDAIVVHGGLLPGVRLEDQDPSDLMNMRSIRADGTASKRVDEGEPWASSWPGPTLAVFGHDAIRGLQRHPHAFGLDTGCVYGGWLTGLWLPDRDLVSVPARGTYANPGVS